MPTSNYHNSNNLRGEPLDHADRRAMKQTEWIKDFFLRYKTLKLTPSSVKRAYDKFFNTDILVTSVRRTLSDLSKGPDAVLRKADIPNTKSPRGGFEGYWELNPPKELNLFPEAETKPRMGEN